LPKIIKIDQCFTKLSENKSGTFLLRHGVIYSKV